MPLCIRQPAPAFTLAGAKGEEIVNKTSLEDFKGRWVFLLFYPMDYTFVCPTELVAYSDALEKFEALNATVVGISGDSPYTHLSWLKAPASQGGLNNNVKLLLLSDVTREVMKAYGVYNADPSGLDYAQAFRGIFLIDPEGKLRHVYINDNGVRRSVDESIRVLKGLQYTDKYGEVCPANWHDGDKGMQASGEGISKFLINKFKKN